MNFNELIYNDWLIVAVALILDLAIGDPEYKFHPIRLIGNLIYKTEKLFRKITQNQKLNGGFFWFFIVGITFACGYLLSLIHPLFSIFITYSCLSIKDLKVKTFSVKKALEKNDLPLARKELSMIVGRETDKLNEKEISRAAVETIAENIVDGILSPLFFYLLGGAPLMIAYKTVNTLDSMVGYKNDKYINFGSVSAKLDDLFNFIPARLSYLFITLGGLFTGNKIFKGIKIGLRDGQKNPSPNSGISEAIVAGLLQIQLGGTNYYYGKKIEKSLIGDSIVELNRIHIVSSIKVAYASGVTSTAAVMIIQYLF